jgi:hypothetical protein
MPFQITRFIWLNQRLHQMCRWRSATTGKTLSDFIQPFIEHVKSGMKALVAGKQQGRVEVF